MEYDRIKRELESPSFKLLRAVNAPLILSFLHQQFKTNQRISIPNSELEAKLRDYLEFIQETVPYPRSAIEYLKAWCEEQFLQKTFESGSDDPVFALTPYTEKAMGWLEDLEGREFVGTESRFLQIFSLLKDIRDNSTTDVETRITQLEQDRDRIQQEIDKIRQTGSVELYNRTQTQEWFLLANQIARQLTSDFAEVEKNFRNLIRKLQQAQLQANTHKGSVIGSVLDADRELKESAQGSSFYAFWNFLISDSQRQKLRELIEHVYNLEELYPLRQQNALLRQIEWSLIDAGEHIVRLNHRLAAKLRQILDEGNLKENRRITELIIDVKRLALQVANQPPLDEFLVLEGDPIVNSIMARPLHPIEVAENTAFSVDFDALPQVNLDEEIAELYQQFYIDEAALAQRIAQLLESQTEVTLAELVEQYPVQQGLSEIAAYLAIATKSGQHWIDDTKIEFITVRSLEPEQWFRLTLPQVIFRR